jgi:hypothetical protein
MEIIDYLRRAWQSIPSDGLKVLLGIIIFGVVGKMIEIWREE